MWTFWRRFVVAAVHVPSTTRASNNVLCAWAMLPLIIAGCSSIEYPRVSGATYYSWLASSYSPVIQFHERRLEGEGLCFHVDGGKAQLRGFVTLADMSSARKQNPELCVRARVRQQAFAEGMVNGMMGGRSDANFPVDREKQLLAELHSFTKPTKQVLDDLRTGWFRGYRYGFRMAQCLNQRE